MTGNRRQATLFLDGNPSVGLIRREFNPEQARLIGPHVTLLREDEVDDWPHLARIIRNSDIGPLKIDFSAPRRNGNFVRCDGSGSAFGDLRGRLLGAPRSHAPHLTLIHPRNGVCDDRVFAEIAARLVPFTHIFREIAFVGQTDGGPWRIIERFPLQLDQ